MCLEQPDGVVILSKTSDPKPSAENEISTSAQRMTPNNNVNNSSPIGRSSDYIESINDSKISYFERKSKYEVIFYNEAVSKMLSIDEVRANLHTPCLLLQSLQR